MNPAVWIPFLTFVFLGPVPAWHLLLHAFLPAWRRHPAAYYALAATVWALVVPLAWLLSREAPQLFAPSLAVRALGLAASGAAFLVAVWSMLTLTPRRFFMWSVLCPDDAPAVRILRGPYRVTAHPTYLAMVVAISSNFLASGSAALLGGTAAFAVLLSIVASLEQRELNARLGASLPERDLLPPSLTPSQRA
jgi:protein-S-isoprenylcysteine O-methyltransferase Ste14